MKEETFYLIEKDGHVLKAKGKAAAYDAWDSFGRGDTKVEFHHIWKGYNRDQWYEDVAPVKRLSRRVIKRYGLGADYYAYAFSYGKNKTTLIEGGE